jgi:TonB-dependent SusC/RagA subfamily outer membrane receptor
MVMGTIRSSTRLLACGAAVVLFASSSDLAAQETGVVRGTVRTADGQPLQGVQVHLPDRGIGVVSNADGRFTINRVPAGTYTVVAEMLGYTTGRRADVAVAAGEVAVVNFELRTQALSLSEIVVTGVTEATSRARLPFTVASVTREDMPVAPKSAVEAIQGKVAGATIVQNTQPGSAGNIILRTPTSINRENSPLIVVDGAILTSSSVDISTLDIESVEVIKGAAAASLYGSRAAAGSRRTRHVSPFGASTARATFRTRSSGRGVIRSGRTRTASSSTRMTRSWPPARRPTSSRSRSRTAHTRGRSSITSSRCSIRARR